MQYDETGTELPVIQQLAAAARFSMQSQADDGGQSSFEFLQPNGMNQPIPFSSTDFNVTLSEFEKDLKGSTAIGSALRRASSFISLAGNAVDAAASQVSRTLTLMSQSKRDALDLRRQLAEGRIEVATTEILTAAAIDEIEKIAQVEHANAKADFQRLANDRGRDLATAAPSQSFAVLMQAYRLTKRNPTLTKSICRTPELMLKRFEELQISTLAY
jgi:predicted transcriptional regulator